MTFQPKEQFSPEHPNWDHSGAIKEQHQQATLFRPCPPCVSMLERDGFFLLFSCFQGLPEGRNLCDNEKWEESKMTKQMSELLAVEMRCSSTLLQAYTSCSQECTISKSHALFCRDLQLALDHAWKSLFLVRVGMKFPNDLFPFKGIRTKVHLVQHSLLTLSNQMPQWEVHKQDLSVVPSNWHWETSTLWQ